METLVQQIVDFAAAHSDWAGIVIFVACFCESLAVVGLIFPGTALLLAAGALVPSGALPLVPVLGGAITGAILGDGVSYGIGRRFGPDVVRVWPFIRRPELVQRGIAFFERHGGKSVFLGRFFGPLRSLVPLAAGVMRMPAKQFWLANIASAFFWAPGVLFPGAIIGEVVGRFKGNAGIAFGVAIVFVLIVSVGSWRRWFRARD